jgi:hypothetical protein
MFGKKKFSEPKKFRWWHGAIIAFIILATVIVGITSRLWPTAWIKIGEESYHVLVADTPQHQFKGLSDRVYRCSLCRSDQARNRDRYRQRDNI